MRLHSGLDVERKIEPVCELLSDLGIADIDQQNLIAMRRCTCILSGRWASLIQMAS